MICNMMFGNFSSLIEFLAAVYVTMTLNNDICRRFWTPNYTNKFRDTLESYNFEGSSKFFDGIVHEVEIHHNHIEDLSQKKGAIMLVLCILALIVIGFEEGLDKRGLAISFYIGSALSIISLLFSNFFLKKWRGVICSISGILLFSFLGYSFSAELIPYVQGLKPLYYIRRIVLVIFILIPIIYQLFINWLHSSIYIQHLNIIFSKEYDDYSKAKRGLANQNDDLVSPDYLQAIGSSQIRKDEKDSVNVLCDVLKNRLSGNTTPSHHTLMICWIKYLIAGNHRNKTESKILNQPSTQQISVVVNATEAATPKPTLDFTAEFKRYNNQKKSNHRLNLKTFCKNERINFKDMTAWLRVYEKKK